MANKKPEQAALISKATALVAPIRLCTLHATHGTLGVAEHVASNIISISSAFAFASCNDANTNNANNVDSTVVAEAVDSAAAVVDSAVAVVDSADAAAIQAVQELGANQE